MADLADAWQDERTALEAIYGDQIRILLPPVPPPVAENSPVGGGELVWEIDDEEGRLPSSVEESLRTAKEAHGFSGPYALIEAFREAVRTAIDSSDAPSVMRNNDGAQNEAAWASGPETRASGRVVNTPPGALNEADDDTLPSSLNEPTACSSTEEDATACALYTSLKLGESALVDGRTSDAAVLNASVVKHGQATLGVPSRTIAILSGEPLEDRRSVFQAHVASVHSVADVKEAMATLLQDRKIARATHNIMAYRIYNAPNVIQDNDDDGETAAGNRLGHLLEVLAVRNVIVVVSRWYGGIQLGADRFKHINSVARQQLELAGFLSRPGSGVAGATKERAQASGTSRASKRR